MLTHRSHKVAADAQPLKSPYSGGHVKAISVDDINHKISCSRPKFTSVLLQYNFKSSWGKSTVGYRLHTYNCKNIPSMFPIKSQIISDLSCKDIQFAEVNVIVVSSKGVYVVSTVTTVETLDHKWKLTIEWANTDFYNYNWFEGGRKNYSFITHNLEFNF